jgi:hypothetical protein
MGVINSKHFWSTIIFLTAIAAAGKVFAAAPAEKFDFEDLKTILKTNRDIKSVDDLLPKLPASYRTFYTLAYKSRSRQGSLVESPRVIAFGSPLEGYEIYGTKAKSTRNDYLVMGFKSDPTLKYGMVPDEDDLEVFEWIPAQRGWIAHDVTFPNRASARTDLADNERFQVSEDNPTECRGCHRYPEMRPNWEAYPHWPGMFGGNFNPYSPLAAESQEAYAEKAAVKLFVEKTQFLPRLKLLDPYPYIKDQFPNPPPVSYKGSDIRNLEITAKLGTLNQDRVARIIEQGPNYPKLKYAIYAGMAGCSDFPGFLADSLRARIRLNYDQLGSQTKATLQDPFYSVGQFQHDRDSELAMVTNMRYLYEGGFGTSIDPWFMNFDRDQFRTNAVNEGLHAAVASKLEVDGKFYLAPNWNDYDLNVYAPLPQPEAPCAILRELSLKAQQN